MLPGRIIGHRGNAGQAPENTLASIRKAHEIGIRWVEIDVALLGDGNPVIHHDQSLRRCTNGKGRLLQSNLESIRKLDAGSWFSPDFAGERIPTLPEVLSLVQELGLGLNLEIKVYRHSVKALVEPVITALRKHWKDRDQLLLSSFSHKALLQCCALAPEFRRGHLFEKLPRRWLDLARKVNAATIHVNYRHLREARARDVIAEGYGLYFYTVNKPELADRLWRWGGRGVFTDCPQNLVMMME